MMALFCLWAVSFSTMIDYLFVYLYAWIVHLLLTITWMLSNFANAVSGIWMIFPILAFIFFPLFNGMTAFGPESILSAITFLFMLRITHRIILILASIISHITPICRKRMKIKINGKVATPADIDKKALLRYNRVVDHMFYFFLSYHVHLYAAVVVVFVQFAGQLAFVIIGWILEYILQNFSQIKGTDPYAFGVVQELDVK